MFRRKFIELKKIPSFLEQVVKQQKEFAQKREGETIVRRLEETQPQDRLIILADHIQKTLSKVLRLAPGQLPGPKEGFFTMGMDSLMAMELKNRIFNYSNIEVLAQYLLKKVLPLESPPEAQKHSPAARDEHSYLSELIEQLSDDKIVSLIAAEFEAHQGD
jgi:hypothetical protein